MIENNIFYEYTNIGASWSNGINGNPPINNLTFKNNIIYSDIPGSLTFYSPVGVGNVASANITNAGPAFIQTNPINWLDFRLQSNSPAINTGTNIGSPYNLAFDPSNVSWPPSTIDQNTQGSAWEIGAFTYRETISDTTPPAAPTGVTVN